MESETLSLTLLCLKLTYLAIPVDHSPIYDSVDTMNWLENTDLLNYSSLPGIDILNYTKFYILLLYLYQSQKCEMLRIGKVLSDAPSWTFLSEAGYFILCRCEVYCKNKITTHTGGTSALIRDRFTRY